jgi:hypothetical protein
MVSSKPNPTHNTAAEDVPFTSGMRIFGGVAWGTITTLLITIVLILIPQVPRVWLWIALPLWVGLISVGIILQWAIARGTCPKCNYPIIVPPMGKRCPQCRAYLKAVDRKIVKVA